MPSKKRKVAKKSRSATKKKKYYWYRLNSEIKKVNLNTEQNPFITIDSVLNNYSPVKAVDFQGVLINNDKYK